MPTGAHKPKDWCSPAAAFGKYDVVKRHWTPPPPERDSGFELSRFRRAVLQHAVALSLIRYKNSIGWIREHFTELDIRPRAGARWQNALNGTTWMVPDDFALIMVILPEAWPNPLDVRTLMRVAEKRIAPPLGWNEVDT